MKDHMLGLWPRSWLEGWEGRRTSRDSSLVEGRLLETFLFFFLSLVKCKEVALYKNRIRFLYRHNLSRSIKKRGIRRLILSLKGLILGLIRIWL